MRAPDAFQQLVAETKDPDEKRGIEIVSNSLTAPLKIIAENAGVSGDVVFSKVKNGKQNYGYNALTGEYTDLVKDMVIDPKKVSRTALENAVSVATMFLTLEVAVTEIPKKDGEQQTGRCKSENERGCEIRGPKSQHIGWSMCPKYPSLNDR